MDVVLVASIFANKRNSLCCAAQPPSGQFSAQRSTNSLTTKNELIKSFSNTTIDGQVASGSHLHPLLKSCFRCQFVFVHHCHTYTAFASHKWMPVQRSRKHRSMNQLLLYFQHTSSVYYASAPLYGESKSSKKSSKFKRAF